MSESILFRYSLIYSLLEIKELLTVLVDGDLDIINNLSFLVLLLFRAGFIVPAEEYGASRKSRLLYTLLFCTFRILRAPEYDAFRCGEGRPAFSAGIPVAVDGRERYKPGFSKVALMTGGIIMSPGGNDTSAFLILVYLFS